MFRIFILPDEKYVNDSFPSTDFFQVEIPCLVKMSWSIKQIVCFSFNQRRVKAILDAFFKNSHARIEDILNVRTDGLNCVICLWLTATYYLKFSLLEPENISFTLSSHGGKRLRHSQRVFLWNLCGCWTISSDTCG